MQPSPLPSGIEATALPVPLRLVQVGPSLDVRGGITSVERLIAAGMRDRCDFVQIASSEDGSPLTKLGVFARSLSALRSLPPDIGRRTLVHIHFASRGSTFRKMLLTHVARRAGHAVVLHAHGGGFREFLDGLPAGMATRVRAWLRSADHLLVLSPQWQRFYQDHVGVPPDRVTVLPNPVKLPARVPERATGEGLHLVCLGRLSEAKGSFDLLRALGSLAPAERRQVELTLAGDGEVAAVRAEAARLGLRATVHDWLGEAQRDALLARADTFVLPSYGEGVPMAMLEAMAFGLPVIATPVGGIPDVVTPGAEGLLVEPGNIAGLTAAIRQLRDPALRQAMGARARASVEAYGLEPFTRRLLAVYSHVLQPAPARAVG